MEVHAYDPSTAEAPEPRGSLKFRANLVYIASPRPVTVTH